MNDVQHGEFTNTGFAKRLAIPTLLMLFGAPFGALTYDAIAAAPPFELPPAEWLASLPRAAAAMLRSSNAPALPTRPATGSGSPGTFALLSLPGAVGRTSGSFSVSANGASVYTVPLWTPTGTRGIEPHLTLAYSSGSPDGAMGPGWSLAGLSSISRCNLTFAQDGAPGAVTLTGSDKFCLDGNRLRLTGGTYGSAGSTYQLELEAFSRITAYGSAGTGPSYYIVEGKDGLLYEYGNTTDSKAYASGGTTPYAWLLNKVRDRQGNNLIVTYSTSSGAYQPASIQYTQSPSLSTTYPYTVLFSYQARVTNLSKYVAGGQIQQTQVLSQINVQSAGSSVKTYNFQYATAPTTVRDRLTAIQECSPTDCLPQTNIGYQDGTAGVASPATSSGSGATVAGTQNHGDFDGDGKEDLIFATQSGLNFAWWVQFATATGYGAPVSTGAVTTSAKTAIFDHFLSDDRDMILAAVSGAWTGYRWNGTSFVSMPSGAPVDPTLGTGINAIPVTSADTDGDGRPDLVWISNPAGGGLPVLQIRQNTTSGSVLSFSTTASQAFTWAGANQVRGNNSYPTSSVRRLDFDGDGRDDVLMSGRDPRGAGINAIGLLSRGTVFAMGSGVGSSGANTTAYLPVNWNSDGCTDMVRFGGTTGNAVFLAFCNGSVPVTSAMTLPNGSAATTAFAADWDGDGRTDLLLDAAGTLQLYRSLDSSVAIPVSTGIATGSGNWMVTDQNGDGLSDVAFANASASYAISFGSHNGTNTPADLATSFVDGFGISANVSYTPITQNNYSKGTGASFPEQEFIGPLYVVPSFTASDGAGSTYTQSFWYYYARVNRQGRGFEGFRARYAIDSRQSFYTIESRLQAFPYTGLVYSRQTNQTASGNPLITYTVPAWTAVTLGSGNDSRFFPYVYSSTDSSYEVGGSLNTQLITQVTSSATVDSFGNPTNTSVTTTDMSASSPFSGEAFTTTTVNTITNDTTNWCLGRPTQTTVQSATPTGSLTRTTSATVDYVNCRNSQEQIEPLSSTLNVTTNYGFDSCGNVNSVAVTGKNPDGSTMATRTTTTNYSYFSITRCQFPERIQNAAGEAATISYNYTWGQPSTKTDPNGISVSGLYDNYGRKTQETRPDGTSTVWSYSACNAANSYCGVADLRWSTTQTEYAVGGGAITSKYRYFDGLNRQRYDEQLNLAGGITYNVVYYDPLGRLYYRYLPVSTGSWNGEQYTFDSLNRMTADSLYLSGGTLDRVTTIAYAGRATTVTDPKGNVTTRYTDARGNLRRVIDPSPGGTTSYTYEPFGKLATTSDPIGAASSMTYNLRGFKIATNDPDGGAWTYSPNSLGEVVSQTDAKSQTTSFVFDAVGRLVQRTEAEGTSNWTYGSSAASHSIGKVVAVSGPSYSETRYFDSIGRPATTYYTADATYQVDYAYNATTGFLDNVTYPVSTSSYRLRVQYGYQNGILNKVSDFNNSATVWWQLNSQDARYHPTNETLGNGVQVSSVYDDLTGHLNTRTSGTSAGSYANHQKLAYQWDKDENLIQRTDQLQSGSGCAVSGLCEAFSYDAVNRLSGSTLNGSTNLAMTYDAAGNISSKTSIGSYTYDPVKRHAVTSTTNGWSFTYDANGNMLTGRGQNITWTSFNKPTAITAGSLYSTFYYTPDRQYFAQGSQYANGSSTTYYIGGLLEKVTTGAVTDYRHQIQAGDVRIVVSRTTASVNNTYYATQDSLGSSSVITDQNANVLVNESFDAFGNRRGSTWSGSPTSSDWAQIATTTRRGFTGHTMVDNLTLVHMKGRVYDAQLGRFLSVDPVIQTIALSQALNPYSYVMNNPLTLTDPSGYSWLSSVFHSVSRYYSSMWHFMTHFGLAGKLPEPVRRVVISIAISVLVGPVVGDFVAATVGSTATAAFGATAGQVLTNVLTDATVNGITSVALGGSFSTGFKTGAIFSGGTHAVYAGFEAGGDWIDFPVHETDGVSESGALQEVTFSAKHSIPVAPLALRTSVEIVGSAVLLGAAPILGAVAGEGALAARGSVTITREGLKQVARHLEQFGAHPPNEAMLERLASQVGSEVSGADANFYIHELSEAGHMASGLGYDAAHAAALEEAGVSPFSLYHPEVITQFPQYFNNAWRAFWSLP